jgi:Ca2+-binding EF-hand superfamily protein
MSTSGTRDDLLRAFERFDANGDGLIDEAEFGDMLASLGWDSPDEMRPLEFAAIDTNADGLVEFDEFADWWLDRN